MDTASLVKYERIDIDGSVFYIAPPSVTAKIGRPIQRGILADDKGQVKFVLMDELVGTVKKGDKVTMNGWCMFVDNEFEITVMSVKVKKRGV